MPLREPACLSILANSDGTQIVDDALHNIAVDTARKLIVQITPLILLRTAEANLIARYLASQISREELALVVPCR